MVLCRHKTVVPVVDDDKGMGGRVGRVFTTLIPTKHFLDIE